MRNLNWMFKNVHVNERFYVFHKLRIQSHTYDSDDERNAPTFSHHQCTKRIDVVFTCMSVSWGWLETSQRSYSVWPQESSLAGRYTARSNVRGIIKSGKLDFKESNFMSMVFLCDTRACMSKDFWSNMYALRAPFLPVAVVFSGQRTTQRNPDVTCAESGILWRMWI